MDNKNEKLIQKYGEMNLTLQMEGDGYYFWGYESLSTFKDDPDLKAAFEKAYDGINEFKTLLEKKITDAGGEPSEWEA